MLEQLLIISALSEMLDQYGVTADSMFTPEQSLHLVNITKQFDSLTQSEQIEESKRILKQRVTELLAQDTEGAAYYAGISE